MYRVALNVAIQDLRKTKKEEKLFSKDGVLKDFSEQEQSNVKEEQLQQLRAAIKNLSKIEKAIMMLYFEEKSNEDIAEIVGITQNYVRVRMNRIKDKLKKNLNP